MISQEAAISSSHLQLDLFHSFTHQQPAQMEHPQSLHSNTHQCMHMHTRVHTHKAQVLTEHECTDVKSYSSKYYIHSALITYLMCANVQNDLS